MPTATTRMVLDLKHGAVTRFITKVKYVYHTRYVPRIVGTRVVTRVRTAFTTVITALVTRMWGYKRLPDGKWVYGVVSVIRVPTHIVVATTTEPPSTEIKGPVSPKVVLAHKPPEPK